MDKGKTDEKLKLQIQEARNEFDFYDRERRRIRSSLGQGSAFRVPLEH